MMDNIREKLVELLREGIMFHYFLTCAEQADYLLANGVTVQEWISVTERLPEEGKDVLAFCYWHESWEVQVCHLSSNWSGQWYTSIAGQWVAVSHWQYLPQPPKGE